jgi:hypothetical protein
LDWNQVHISIIMFDLLVIRSTEDQSNNAIKDFIALITLTIFYKHLLQITKFI